MDFLDICPRCDGSNTTRQMVDVQEQSARVIIVYTCNNDDCGIVFETRLANPIKEVTGDQNV
jgi:hypothetical protein